MDDKLTAAEAAEMMRRITDGIHALFVDNKVPKGSALACMGVAIAESYPDKPQMELALGVVRQWAEIVANAPPEEFTDNPQEDPDV